MTEAIFAINNKNIITTDDLKNHQKIITILIDGGDYTSESGEEFPIIIPRGVNLFKSNENNKSVKIQGFGTDRKGNEVSMILEGGNRLNSISISSLNHIGILSLDRVNSLNFTTLSNNRTAIGLLNNSNITLNEVLITDNSYSGIELSDNSKIKLINTEITKSNIGVLISDSAMIVSSSENSKIIQNTQCDLYTSGVQNLNLQDIQWDSDVFSFNVEYDCSNGANIVKIGEGTVNYQPIPNTTLLFGNGMKMVLTLYLQVVFHIL